MKKKKILAAISALTILCGAVPTQPFADIIGNTAITASADWISCETCNGTGRVGHSCDTCSGSGKVECQDCSGDGGLLEECILCHGDGVTGLLCPRCDGSGIEHEWGTCDLCNGIGYCTYDYYDCYYCEGRGYINNSTKCNNCFGTGKLTLKCPKCNGIGTCEYLETCTTCKGNDLWTCYYCGGKGTTLDMRNICKSCNGAGKIACKNCEEGTIYDTCPECNGLGNIEVESTIIEGTCGAAATYKFDYVTGKLTISGEGTIGRETFASWSIDWAGRINEVVIGSGITTIGEIAFNGCTKLTSVEMNSVETIGYQAFDGCKSLKSITLGSTFPDGFDNIPVSAKINIPVEAYENYEDCGYELGFSDIKGIGYTLDGKIGIELATELSADKLTVKYGDKKIELAQKDEYVEFYVAAQDMAKEYTVYYIADGNNIEIAKFNPKNNLSGYEDTKYEEVAEALITYCEAANAYFNGGEVAGVSSEYDDVINAITPNNADMGENYYGSSLLLESDTVLRHYYTEEVAGYTGIKGDYYYIDETVDPTKFAATGKYSVNDYIYKALTSGKADKNLKNLCVALYKYGAAAEAYNGGNN